VQLFSYSILPDTFGIYTECIHFECKEKIDACLDDKYGDTIVIIVKCEHCDEHVYYKTYILLFLFGRLIKYDNSDLITWLCKTNSFEQWLVDMNGCLSALLIFYVRLLLLNNWPNILLTTYFNEREREREREREKGALRPINANRLYTDE